MKNATSRPAVQFTLSCLDLLGSDYHVNVTGYVNVSKDSRISFTMKSNALKLRISNCFKTKALIIL